MIRLLLASAALALVPLGPVAAGTIAPAADEICPIRVGSAVPPSEVRTVDGEAVNLRSKLLGAPSVLLVYRGGWCPICTRQFAELRHATETLTELGVQLFAISVDDPERLAAGREEDTSFTLLSDFELNASTDLGLAFQVEESYLGVLDDYGIDPSGNALATEGVLPVPAVFVVDKNAVVTFSYANPDYRVRLDPDVLVAAARSTVEAHEAGSE